MDVCAMIKDIKLANGWSTTRLAKELGVSVSTVSTWDNGRYTPRQGVMRKLRQLCGEIDPGDRIPRLQKLKDIFKVTGMTKREVAKEIGVSYSLLKLWMKEVRDPDNSRFVEAIDNMYDKYVTNSDIVPEEAPENLNEVIDMNKTEPVALNDWSALPFSTESLEPTSFEQLNPPDVSDLNQAPIDNGYARFLENLRFFMKDTRWDTDEKLETHLNLKPGYISEFGKHRDRFEELLTIGEICDLIGIPWSVLAFSQAAKEDRLARINFQIEQFNIALANLQGERDILNSELAKNAGC